MFLKIFFPYRIYIIDCYCYDCKKTRDSHSFVNEHDDLNGELWLSLNDLLFIHLRPSKRPANHSRRATILQNPTNHLSLKVLLLIINYVRINYIVMKK